MTRKKSLLQDLNALMLLTNNDDYYFIKLLLVKASVLINSSMKFNVDVSLEEERYPSNS